MAHSTLQIFQKPQQLICITEQRNLEINQDVLAQLRTIEGQLVVVTVIGSYRGGKSWLLNRLGQFLQTHGFVVKKGQTAVTRGIWIACRDHPTKENCILVYLDTEGLYNVFTDDATNEDNKLFMVAFLLSNILIYNVRNQFNDTDLQKLGFITRISANLRREETLTLFPEFLLVIRDVAELVVDGNIVSPDEYLDRVLRSGQANEPDTSPRACLLNNFTRRHCFTLTQPAEFNVLNSLGQLDNPTLSSEYVEDEQRLREYIHNADFMRIGGGSLCTVSFFCEMVSTVVKVVKNGRIPELPSLQQQLAQEENKRVFEQAKSKFLKEMETDTSLQECVSRSQAFLASNLVPENEEQINVIINNFVDFTAERTLDFLLQPVLKRSYGPPGGEDKFNNEVRRIRQEYDVLCFGPGIENDTVWEQKEIYIHRRRMQLREEDRRVRIRRLKETALEVGGVLATAAGGIALALLTRR